MNDDPLGILPLKTLKILNASKWHTLFYFEIKQDYYAMKQDYNV